MAPEPKEEEKPIKTLSEDDIRLLKTVSVMIWGGRALPAPPAAAAAASRLVTAHALLGAPDGPSPQYGAGPYSSKIKTLEADIKAIAKKVNEVSGVKESDTGLAHPSRWDLVSDKQAMQEEQPLQVGGRQWLGAGRGWGVRGLLVGAVRGL